MAARTLQKLSEWSVTPIGVLYSRRRIEANVLQYRRLMRHQVYSLIRSLEEQITCQAGSYLPVRVPRKGSWSRDYWPDLHRATGHGRHRIRYWQGRQVTGQVRFWGHHDQLAGIDHLLDAVGYSESPAAGEGQADRFDAFVALVQHNRELRGRGGLYGMLRYGLEERFARLVAEDEWGLLLLGGTVSGAADLVVKQLEGLDGRYDHYDLPPDELDHRRSLYQAMVEEGADDDALLGLLTDEDQQLLGFAEAIFGTQRLVVRRLAICANSDEFEPLAEIVPLRPRHRRARRVPRPVRELARAIGSN